MQQIRKNVLKNALWPFVMNTRPDIIFLHFLHVAAFKTCFLFICSILKKSLVFLEKEFNTLALFGYIFLVLFTKYEHQAFENTEPFWDV